MIGRRAWLASVAGLGIAATGCAIPLLTTGVGEREADRSAAEQVAAEIGLVGDPALVGYLRAVGARLAEHSPRADVPYTFHVVDMVETNAFALPGGTVYVSRGLLSLLNSEDELAGVVAHEIGHVAARHHVKRQVRRAPFLPVRVATGLGSVAAGIVSPTLGRTVAALGQLPGALVIAPYSRGQENEADELGQQIAAAAGYDPAALSSVMRTLSREEALFGHDPNRRSFLASHPSSPERTRRTAERAARLERAPGRPVAAGRDAFLARLDGVLVGPGASGGVFVETRFLHRDFDFTVEFPEGWQTRNTPSAVAAIAPDEAAMAVVALAGEGDDPLAAARAFAERGRAELDAAPESVRLGELAAARALARADDARLQLHWIAHRGRVFQLTAAAQRGVFGERRSELERIARSFRPLERAEHAEIRESRLRLVRARARDTLERLVERHGSTWSPEQAAVANGLEVDAPLDAGVQIKLAVPEVYAPR